MNLNEGRARKVMGWFYDAGAGLRRIGRDLRQSFRAEEERREKERVDWGDVFAGFLGILLLVTLTVRDVSKAFYRWLKTRRGPEMTPEFIAFCNTCGASMVLPRPDVGDAPFVVMRFTCPCGNTSQTGGFSVTKRVAMPARSN